MGGFFGGNNNPTPPPAQPAPPVQPRPAVRASDDSPEYRKKRKVSGERATILTGTQGLTASGDSTSVKTLLGG
ncbi:hypothetical protein [uncultured Mediterranean phage uvMED]|nr:hypothetical protein [uncultured Mediterranean phage uvMED]